MRWSKPAPWDGRWISAGSTTTARWSSTPSTAPTIRPPDSSWAGSEASVERRGSEGKAPLPDDARRRSSRLPEPSDAIPLGQVAQEVAEAPSDTRHPDSRAGSLSALLARRAGRPRRLLQSQCASPRRIGWVCVTCPPLLGLRPSIDSCPGRPIAARPRGTAIPGTDPDPRSAGLVRTRRAPSPRGRELRVGRGHGYGGPPPCEHAGAGPDP